MGGEGVQEEALKRGERQCINQRHGIKIAIFTFHLLLHKPHLSCNSLPFGKELTAQMMRPEFGGSGLGYVLELAESVSYPGEYSSTGQGEKPESDPSTLFCKRFGLSLVLKQRLSSMPLRIGRLGLPVRFSMCSSTERSSSTSPVSIQSECGADGGPDSQNTGCNTNLSMWHTQ